MIVAVGSGGHTVTEADVLTDLKVVTPLIGADLDAAVRAAALGRADASGAHVLIDIDRLRALARTTATLPDWDERFDAMIAYARRKGWVTEDGGAVRAHVDA